MLSVIAELTRVSRGLVLVNCAGVTRQRCYWPGPEGLCWEWFKRGGNLWRPAYWHRVGIPGSGGKQWLRADIEYVLAFKRDAEWLPWADNTANGHAPKWAPGGEMSHRQSTGARCNQWGAAGSARGMGAKRADGDFCSAARPSHHGVGPNRRQDGTYKLVTRRSANGQRARKVVSDPAKARNSIESTYYSEPVLANPGNLFRTNVGGGVMGHPLSHENEAPFPIALAAWFIRSWCPPGGLVLDPFSGSGTTCDAAWREGRRGIGLDLRMSQCELGRRRLLSPNAKRASKTVESPEPSLFAEAS